jgi:two-component system LytT family response regulator
MNVKKLVINSSNEIRNNIWLKRSKTLDDFLIDKLLVRTNKHIYILETSKIIFIKASSNYSIIYFNDNKSIVTSKTLKYYENILHDKKFLRVHSSYLINLSFINGIQKNGIYTILLKNDIKIPISRSFKEILFSKIL